MTALSRQAVRLAGVLAFPTIALARTELSQSAVQFVVQAPTYEELDKLVEAMIAKARTYPGLANLDSDLKLNKPQLSVELDRNKSSASRRCGRARPHAGDDVGSRQVTRFKREASNSMCRALEIGPSAANRSDRDLRAWAGDGALIQLSNLVKLQERWRPRN